MVPDPVQRYTFVVEKRSHRSPQRLPREVEVEDLGTVLTLEVADPADHMADAVGVRSIGVAYLYSARPRPMAYMGLGELMVFTFLGIVILEGDCFVQEGHLGISGPRLAALSGLSTIVNN